MSAGGAPGAAGTIVVMAKAPRPGYAKTRLEPLLGGAGCARLQAALIGHTVATAAEAAAGGAVEVHHAPAGAGPELAALLPPGTALLPQAGGDLGARMSAAVAGARARRAGPVTVVGTDVPALGAVHLHAARQALADGVDACFGPARDGGYYLLALARPAPGVFAIPPDAWGGGDVLGLSVAAARAAGLRVALLGPEADLDTPEDARRALEDPRVPAAVAELLRPAPARS